MWQERAACIGKGEIFLKEGRGNIDYSQARAICAMCPVFKYCRQEALHLSGRQDNFGFRAGMSPKQRRAERKRLGIKATRHNDVLISIGMFHITKEDKAS